MATSSFRKHKMATPYTNIERQFAVLIAETDPQHILGANLPDNIFKALPKVDFHY